MQALARILLFPITIPGAVLGACYAALTGRHPSSRLLMALGVAGFALIVFALMSGLRGGS
jgi:hypothetical protein